MLKVIKGICAIIFFCILFITSAYGYTFRGGFYERIRYELRKNITDLENGTKDNMNYFKIKTSLWGQLDFDKNSDLYIKLTNENKAYIYWAGASAAAGKSATKKGYRYEIDEVIFDNFYLDFRNFINLPLDLRLGRQDLDNYGEGFLIKEGTPGDSTRTIYFNAAKATWHAFDKNDLDLIFIKDDKTDDLLPVINRLSGGGQVLTSSNESAGILYNKNDTFKNLHLENYYIYKNEAAAGSSTPLSLYRMTRQETRLNTLGSFGQYKFDPWMLRGQFAYQFGKYGTQDRTGLGGYAFLERDLKDLKWNPKISLGFVYFSGDKASTAKNEAWDPLFSRYPWLPEVFGLYLGSETQTYYWANFNAYNAVFSFAPGKRTKITFKYYFLRANEEVAPSATLFSGSGKNRGHLPEVRLDYSINKNINACFDIQYFIPGNFYVKTADPAVFLKTELQAKF